MIQPGTATFWRATLALCLGSFMIFANVYLPQPLLPDLAVEFSVSALDASHILTITTLTLGVSLLFFGPLSDAIGRTGLIYLTMAGVVLCTLLLSQADSLAELVLLRAIQGVCLAGLPAIAIAYMGDEFSKPALLVAVGIYISGNTLGGVGGRLIGGFVGDWLGWQGAFLAMAGLSLVLFLLFIWLLPASQAFKPVPVRPAKMVRDIGAHLSNPLLLLAYLIGGFNFFIFINQYSFATFLLAAEPYALPASLLGMLFLTYLSGTLGSALSGRFARYLSQPLIILLAIGMMMLGSLVTLLVSAWMIVLGFLISAFGFFVAHSCASSWVSHTAEHARATASSVYLVFYYLGASSGGYYLNMFWQQQGWSGVVQGSLLVLTGTAFCACLLFFLQQKTALVEKPQGG